MRKLLILILLLVSFQAHAQDSSYFKKVYKRFYNRYVKFDTPYFKNDSIKGFRPHVKYFYHKFYKRFVKVDSSIIDRDSSKGFSSKPVAVPVGGFSPEKKFQVGLALIYSFYRNNFDVKALGNSLFVNVGFFHLYEIRYRFKPIVWGKTREFRLSTQVDFQHYPLNFYGIGNHTYNANVTQLKYLNFSNYDEIQRRISKKIMFGIALNAQFNRITDRTDTGFYESFKNIVNPHGGSILEAGPTVLFDTRNFQNFADKGDYLRVLIYFSPAFLNPSSNTLTSFNIDARHYTKIAKNQILCFNLVSNGFINSQVPFVFLNQLGGSQIMRGYYLGRYRDKDMTAAQVEYRYRVIPRMAGALFTGTGLVYGYDSFSLENLKPEFGGGIRYIFDLASRSTIRLDYAVGEKPSGERRIQGFYLAINEAF